MHNVADDAAYSNIKNELRNKLMEVLIKSDDPRVVEIPCRYEMPSYAGKLQQS